MFINIKITREPVKPVKHPKNSTPYLNEISPHKDKRLWRHRRQCNFPSKEKVDSVSILYFLPSHLELSMVMQRFTSLQHTLHWHFKIKNFVSYPSEKIWLWPSLRATVRTPTACKPMPNVRLFWRESVWPPASCEADTTIKESIKTRTESRKFFCICVVFFCCSFFSIKLRSD